MNSVLRRALRVVFIFLAGVGVLACGLHVAHSPEPIETHTGSSHMRIATYNVHWIAMQMDDGPWSPSGWGERKTSMTKVVMAFTPDVLALQEAESFPDTNRNGTNLVVSHLKDTLPGYSVAASGAPQMFPSTQPILYRTDKLKLTEQGWFFFSDTPDQIYSRTFNGSYPAYASWAEFATKDGIGFRVVNIHTDFSSRSNRLRSAALVRDRIKPWIDAGQQVIVLGDFNARSGAKTLRVIEKAGVSFPKVPGATFHMNRGLHLFGAIDHIGHTSRVTPIGAPVIVRTKPDDIWPSDHYPVYLDMNIKN